MGKRCQHNDCCNSFGLVLVILAQISALVAILSPFWVVVDHEKSVSGFFGLWNICTDYLFLATCGWTITDDQFQKVWWYVCWASGGLSFILTVTLTSLYSRYYVKMTLNKIKGICLCILCYVTASVIGFCTMAFIANMDDIAINGAYSTPYKSNLSASALCAFIAVVLYMIAGVGTVIAALRFGMERKSKKISDKHEMISVYDEDEVEIVEVDDLSDDGAWSEPNRKKKVPENPPKYAATEKPTQKGKTTKTSRVSPISLDVGSDIGRFFRKY